MECYGDVDTTTTLKKWIILIFSWFRAELQMGLFLLLFLRLFPILSHLLIFAVLTLFRGPESEFHSKFVFFTNFGHTYMNNVSYVAICLVQWYPEFACISICYTTLCSRRGWILFSWNCLLRQLGPTGVAGILASAGTPLLDYKRGVPVARRPHEGSSRRKDEDNSNTSNTFFFFFQQNTGEIAQMLWLVIDLLCGT
jgi:hypothetical protein